MAPTYVNRIPLCLYNAKYTHVHTFVFVRACIFTKQLWESWRDPCVYFWHITPRVASCFHAYTHTTRRLFESVRCTYMNFFLVCTSGAYCMGLIVSYSHVDTHHTHLLSMYKGLVMGSGMYRLTSTIHWRAHTPANFDFRLAVSHALLHGSLQGMMKRKQ